MANELDFDKLQNCVERLHMLLTSREVGVSSWHSFLYDRLRELSDLIEPIVQSESAKLRQVQKLDGDKEFEHSNRLAALGDFKKCPGMKELGEAWREREELKAKLRATERLREEDATRSTRDANAARMELGLMRIRAEQLAAQCESCEKALADRNADVARAREDLKLAQEDALRRLRDALGTQEKMTFFDALQCVQKLMSSSTQVDDLRLKLERSYREHSRRLCDALGTAEDLTFIEALERVRKYFSSSGIPLDNAQVDAIEQKYRILGPGAYSYDDMHKDLGAVLTFARDLGTNLRSALDSSQRALSEESERAARNAAECKRLEVVVGDLNAVIARLPQEGSTCRYCSQKIPRGSKWSHAVQCEARLKNVQEADALSRMFYEQDRATQKLLEFLSRMTGIPLGTRVEDAESHLRQWFDAEQARSREHAATIARLHEEGVEALLARGKLARYENVDVDAEVRRIERQHATAEVGIARGVVSTHMHEDRGVLLTCVRRLLAERVDMQRALDDYYENHVELIRAHSDMRSAEGSWVYELSELQTLRAAHYESKIAEWWAGKKDRNAETLSVFELCQALDALKLDECARRIAASEPFDAECERVITERLALGDRLKSALGALWAEFERVYEFSCLIAQSTRPATKCIAGMAVYTSRLLTREVLLLDGSETRLRLLKDLNVLLGPTPNAKSRH